MRDIPYQSQTFATYNMNPRLWPICYRISAVLRTKIFDTYTNGAQSTNISSSLWVSCNKASRFMTFLLFSLSLLILVSCKELNSPHTNINAVMLLRRQDFMLDCDESTRWKPPLTCLAATYLIRQRKQGICHSHIKYVLNDVCEREISPLLTFGAQKCYIKVC